MDRMFVSPQQSYVEALSPQCDSIRRWSLWEVLSLDEAMRVGP